MARSEEFAAGRGDSPEKGTVECDECGQRHPAEIAHRSTHGSRQMYAVICDKSPGVVDYYQQSRVRF